MSQPALILCGSAGLSTRAKPWQTAKPLRVKLHGDDRTATLKIEDLSSAMTANLPPVVADLVEIASYVYCADQGRGRGGRVEFEYGTKWRRRFRFEVPVRCPEKWSSPEVRRTLCDMLGFLSDDEYEFAFTRLEDGGGLDQYLELGQGSDRAPPVDTVMLFSGGLDSLTGAVEEVLTRNRRVALVSHRSVAKIDSRQRHLVDDLVAKAKRGRRPHHIPVWVHLHGVEAHEYTQRSRSFLFAALGAAVATMYGLDVVTFFENGVTSLNLPICEQVVGGRATRTTHPRVLRGFSTLFRQLFERDFRVEAPYANMTKTDVVLKLKGAGHAAMGRNTVSCTRTMALTNLHTHCGRCSQCIDRRFAMLAAEYGDDDPAEMYAVDLFTGERDTPEDRIMIESWVGMANSMESMGDPLAFFTAFPQANDAVSYSAGRSDDVATRFFDLHRRHGAQVGAVIERSLADHAGEMRRGDLADTCLLRMLGPRTTKASSRLSRNDIPGPIANADLATKAGVVDAAHMSRDIQAALKAAGCAFKPGGSGMRRSWSHRQLDRAAGYLPEGGKLRVYLEH